MVELQLALSDEKLSMVTTNGSSTKFDTGNYCLYWSAISIYGWENCSSRLAMKNYQWLQQMDLQRNLTPAIIAFTGLQYQYMAPSVFSDDGLKYVQDNLRILSGLYGI